MTAMQKPIPKKYARQIAHWDDERAYGNSFIVMLKNGWRFPISECHTSGFDTVKEAIEGLREIEPCHCEGCTKSPNILPT